MEPVDVKIKGIPFPILFGIVSIIAGLYYLVLAIVDPNMEGPVIIAGYIVLVISGIIILINRRKVASEHIPFIGITLGMVTIMGNLYSDSELFRWMIPIEFLNLVLGTILIYLAIANKFQYRYNVARSFHITVILLLLTLIPVFLEYEFFYSLMTYQEMAWVYIVDNLPMDLYYILFIYLLTRDGIRYKPVMERVRNNIVTLKGNFYTDGREYIEPVDLRNFISNNRSNWNMYSKGPIESEKRILLRSPELDRDLCIQKWRDKDHLTLTILPKGCSQITEGFFFEACETVVSESGDSVTFFNDKGEFIRINVRETVVKTRIQKITHSG